MTGKKSHMLIDGAKCGRIVCAGLWTGPDLCVLSTNASPRCRSISTADVLRLGLGIYTRILTRIHKMMIWEPGWCVLGFLWLCHS